MKLIEALPNELNETLNNLEFDDEAGVLIESVKFVGDDLQLAFSIRFFGGGSSQLWEVTVVQVKKEKITRNWTQSIEIYKKHPLLLEYIDVHTELYFRGTTTNWADLFMDIFQSITQFTEGIDNFRDYLFLPERIKELSQQGYGLFARGPKAILEIYGKCLLRQKIKPIYIGEFNPRTENESKLLLIGDSYFIGQAFEFKRKQ
jgi:hypothetical protein